MVTEATFEGVESISPKNVTLARILQRIGCERLAETFNRHRITDDLLADLTESDLAEAGLLIGERKLFLRTRAELEERTDVVTPEGSRAAITEPAHHAERRRLTVMFVDLVDSTRFSGRLDPEEWRAILGGYHREVAQIVERFGGHIAQYLGDGVLCYFGWPVAMEDAAIRSVEAALGVTRRTGELLAAGEPMSCRVGIATGLVVVGEIAGGLDAMDESAVGETPNFAARLQSLAAPRSVVISDSTRRLLGNAFVLEDIGEHVIRGLSDRHRVHRVLRANPAHVRFSDRESATGSTLIGREAELGLILSRWARARQGEGQLVNLVGEAGIGKSRICRALFSAIADEPSHQITYQCSPYHRDTALWPVVSELVASCGIDDRDSMDERFAKLESLLGRVADFDEGDFFLIADLIGLDAEGRFGPKPMSPSARRAATLAAIAHYLIGLSRRQPVLLMIEDVHWSDPTTAELVASLLDFQGSERMMMLLTSRPERSIPLPPRSQVSDVVLNRLGRRDAQAIIELLGGAVLSPETIQLIVDRADGIPLFVEELTKAMLESGDIHVPASLHDTLMARLDRLPEVKEIAQIASVFGREFETDPLSNVAKLSHDGVLEALEKLRDIELVYSRLGSDNRFLFKHALVRDAAYESLLNRRKREIHGRIFEVLRDDPSTVPGVLAHHAAEAGWVAEAVEYGKLAVEQALRRPAYSEAIAHADAALAVIESSDLRAQMSELRRQLLRLAGQARIAHLGYAHEATVRTYAEIERIARETRDDDLLIDGLYGRWAGHYVPGDLPSALDVADEILRVSRRSGDRFSSALGNRLRGSVLTMMGRTAEAHEALDRAEARYDRALHGAQAARFGQDVGIAASCYRIGCLTLEGKIEEATVLATEVMRDLEQIGHAHTSGYALGHLACFLSAAGVEPMAAEVADRCVALSERDRMPLWAALGRASAAVARIHSEGTGDALSELGDAVELLDRLAFNVFRPMHLPVLSMAYGRAGKTEQAAAVNADARRLVERFQGRYSAMEVERADAELLRAEGRSDEAEACLRRALETARKAGHLVWEFRLSRTLADLLSVDAHSAASSQPHHNEIFPSDESLCTRSDG